MNNIKKIIKNGIMITSFTLLSGGLIHQFEQNDLILEEKVLQEVKANGNISEELQQKYIKILEEDQFEEVEEVEKIEEVEEVEKIEEVEEELEDLEELEEEGELEAYYNSLLEEIQRLDAYRAELVEEANSINLYDIIIE